MPGSSPLVQAVTERLRRYPRLDAQAVLAVAAQEGLGGGIGDGGHAFGPFQLNDAGGVITNKFPGWSTQQKQQWATSPVGIDYALSGIDRAAGGLHGGSAVDAIVSRFERPADIPGEIARARAGYGLPPAPSSYQPAPAAPAAGPSLTRLAAAPAGPTHAAVSPALLEQLVNVLLGRKKA